MTVRDRERLAETHRGRTERQREKETEGQKEKDGERTVHRGRIAKPSKHMTMQSTMTKQNYTTVAKQNKT